eukprot:4636204-Amphidinium_carterae.1
MPNQNTTPSLATNTWWPCQRCQTGWEWCRKSSCRKCGADAPAWVVKTFGARAGQSNDTQAGKPPHMCKPNETGAQDREGFARVARRTRRRNRAGKPANAEAQDAQALTQADVEMAEPEHDTNEGQDRTALQQKIKRLEETLKALGEDGPPVVVAGLVEAIEEGKSRLRQITPTARRLQALQQGLDRRQQKLGKIDKKLTELHVAAAALEPAMAAALLVVQQEYRAKKVAMDKEIMLIQEQRRTAGE